MQILLNAKKLSFSSCVLSIGNFDGVHIGHQALLKKLLEKKKEYQVPSVVISFDPHPVEFFTGKKIRLFSCKDLGVELKKIGIDYLILLKFDKNLSALSAMDFLEKNIYSIGPKAMVVGQDFCFGHKASGSVKFLKDWALSKSVDMEVFPDVYWGGGKVSSSRLRSCYKEKNWQELEFLLGRSAPRVEKEK